MKEIIIKAQNAQRIMEAIKAVQGKATARTIDSYAELENIVKSVESRIGGMSKTELEGTEFIYDDRQHFPNAYKWRPESTWIKCRYSKGSWRLTDTGRGYCPNSNSSYRYALYLSESAKAAILKRYQ